MPSDADFNWQAKKMWPFFQTQKARAARLSKVLLETKAFVGRSEESIWAGLSPAEIAMDLSIAAERIEKGEAIDSDHLNMLFAPTGPIQEIAISSGWSNDYMKLSSEFDALIEKCR